MEPVDEEAKSVTEKNQTGSEGREVSPGPKEALRHKDSSGGWLDSGTASARSQGQGRPGLSSPGGGGEGWLFLLRVKEASDDSEQGSIFLLPGKTKV